MKPTISILGCGWLGLPLGASLVREGYTVCGSTRSEDKMDTIAGAGMRPFLISINSGVSGQIDDFFSSNILILTLPPNRLREDVAGRYPGRVASVMAKALQGGVSRVIFTSSTGVYGALDGEVTEQMKLMPDTEATQGLAAAERMLIDQNQLEAVILRLAGLIGPGRHPARFLAGKTDLPNGAHPVNLVHLDDCIDLISLLIARDVKKACLNVCANEHPSREQYYTQMALRAGLPPPQFNGHNTGQGKLVSCQKLKTVMGYECRHSIWLADEGVPVAAL